MIHKVTVKKNEQKLTRNSKNETQRHYSSVEFCERRGILDYLSDC